MNFLKKLSGLTSSSSNSKKRSNGEPEDPYDDYIVEAPPHPSELLAVGIDPNQIDTSDPEKLKQIYKEAKAKGLDKKVNSVLLAKQKQLLDIEEKKKDKEEWKFFESLTARVEATVKQSQQALEQIKTTSAIDKITEPEFELRLTPEDIFRGSATSKVSSSDINEQGWIAFEDDSTAGKKADKQDDQKISEESTIGQQGDDNNQNIVEELLEDFGLDLRPNTPKVNIPVTKLQETTAVVNEQISQELDPFDTSYVTQFIKS